MPGKYKMQNRKAAVKKNQDKIQTFLKPDEADLLVQQCAVSGKFLSTKCVKYGLQLRRKI